MNGLSRFVRSFVPGLLTLLAAACTHTGMQYGDAQASGVAIATQTCSACHGVTGQSVSPLFPQLAGQQKEYLVAQLGDFKAHSRADERGTEYMWGFTRLTPRQIDELADYFSTQTPMHGPSPAPAPDLRGQAIFAQGLPELGVPACSACHGAQGLGQGSFPRLAGQHADYVMQQIRVFQLTDTRPRGAAMKQVTHALSEADTAAVARYIAALSATP